MGYTFSYDFEWYFLSCFFLLQIMLQDLRRTHNWCAEDIPLFVKLRSAWHKRLNTHRVSDPNISFQRWLVLFGLLLLTGHANDAMDQRPSGIGAGFFGQRIVATTLGWCLGDFRSRHNLRRLNGHDCALMITAVFLVIYIYINDLSSIICVTITITKWTTTFKSTLTKKRHWLVWASNIFHMLCR